MHLTLIFDNHIISRFLIIHASCNDHNFKKVYYFFVIFAIFAIFVTLTQNSDHFGWWAQGAQRYLNH